MSTNDDCPYCRGHERYQEKQEARIAELEAEAKQAWEKFDSERARRVELEAERDGWATAGVRLTKFYEGKLTAAQDALGVAKPRVGHLQGRCTYNSDSGRLEDTRRKCDDECPAQAIDRALSALGEEAAQPREGLERKSECPAWCGTIWNTHPSHHGGALSYKRGRTAPDDDRCYCSLPCRDAGKPLSPATRERTP